MHMVKMASHEVVRMVVVGNSFMAAARAVPVGGFVLVLHMAQKMAHR